MNTREFRWAVTVDNQIVGADMWIYSHKYNHEWWAAGKDVLMITPYSDACLTLEEAYEKLTDRLRLRLRDQLRAAERTEAQIRDLQEWYAKQQRGDSCS